jgi:Flp pilus assembly protein TadD
MQTKFFIILALMLATGCQTSRNGIASRTPLRMPRTPGMTTASNSEDPHANFVEDLPIAQARALEKKGELARAEAIYQRALQENPRHALAAHRLAVIADRRGQFEQSAWYFEKGLFIDPENADIRGDYGYSLYMQRKWQEAAAQYQRALASDPRHERTHNNFGLLLARTGRSAEALAAFREAGCGLTEAKMNLAFILTTEGQPALAQQQLDEARQAVVISSTMRERMDELQRWIAEAVEKASSVPREQAVAEQSQPQKPITTVSQRRQPAGIPEEANHPTPAIHSSLR